MKRAHKIIFIVLLILSSFSAYSLAEMNQVHNIDFEWYGGGGFVDGPRLTFGEWTNPKYPQYFDFEVITDPSSVVTINGGSSIKYVDMPKVDFDNEFLIFATLGEVSAGGYNIKVKEMARRGNVVEIMVDMAQPKLYSFLPFKRSYPYDIVKVSKDKLELKGDLIFIFKDYNGAELFRKIYNIDVVKSNL